MTNKKHYRLYVINKLPQLRVLDFQKVKLKVCEQGDRQLNVTVRPSPVSFHEPSACIGN